LVNECTCFQALKRDIIDKSAAKVDDFLKECKDSAFKTKLRAWNKTKQKSTARCELEPKSIPYY